LSKDTRWPVGSHGNHYNMVAVHEIWNTHVQKI